jgi:midasin
MSKFEKLLDLLVNEQKDEAEKVFHEIVVEKSRQIYEGILAEEEETSEADESSDKAEGDEVDEAKDESTDSEDKVEETADEEEVEETEEPAESTDETIEEIGGDATDDLISDIEAEAEGMDDMEMPGEEGDDEGEEGDEAEEMFEPLEKELDALKAEFAKMMDDDKEDAPEESFAESKDADTIVKEYAEEVKKGLSASSESGADQTHSPVSKGGKSYTSAGAHKIGDGAEEKGGVGKALSGDTAKDMGVHAKNEGGIKSAKLEKAPAPMTKEANADKSSPVAKK